MEQNKNINNAFSSSLMGGGAGAVTHNVTIENHTKTVVTGVAEVVSATERAVLVKLADGTLEISGNGLRVEKLSPEEKMVIILGEVTALKYGVGKETKNLLKRLFK